MGSKENCKQWKDDWPSNHQKSGLLKLWLASCLAAGSHPSRKQILLSTISNMDYDEHRCARYELWPTSYLGGTGSETRAPDEVALIILNTPITGYDYFRRLYDHASFRICADGGANRLLDLLVQQHPELSFRDAIAKAPPTLIHGDLDSLTADAQKRYESAVVEITHDPDQYSTDFGKAIKQVIDRLPNAKDVLVLGTIGGRLDQGIGLLGELYREQKVRHPDVRFWLFSDASISTVLTPGTTTLHTPLQEGVITRNIGILPLYGPAVISTEGLEWDVWEWPTEMGGQVSTSNHIVKDKIVVKTNHDVLFTVERHVG